MLQSRRPGPQALVRRGMARPSVIPRLAKSSVSTRNPFVRRKSSNLPSSRCDVPNMKSRSTSIAVAGFLWTASAVLALPAAAMTASQPNAAVTPASAVPVQPDCDGQPIRVAPLTRMWNRMMGQTDSDGAKLCLTSPEEASTTERVPPAFPEYRSRYTTVTEPAVNIRPDAKEAR